MVHTGTPGLAAPLRPAQRVSHPHKTQNLRGNRRILTAFCPGHCGRCLRSAGGFTAHTTTHRDGISSFLVRISVTVQSLLSASSHDVAKVVSWAPYSREQNECHVWLTLSCLTRLLYQNTPVPRIPPHRISIRQVWPQKNPFDHHDRQHTLSPGVRDHTCLLAAN